MTNPYEALGVSRTATAEEIKSAYRKKAKEYHPDLHPDDPHATDKMNEINQAYEILSDANKKAMYDAGYTDNQGRPKTNPYNNFYYQQNQNTSNGFRYYTYNPFTGFRSYGGRPESTDANSQNGNPYSNGGGILGPTGRRILRIVGFLLLWRVIGRFLPFWFFFF